MRLRTILLTLTTALAVAGPAYGSGTAVVRDCTDDGRLAKSYSQKDYREALANMPTDVDEYTDCRDVIRRAQLGDFSSGSGSGSGTHTGGGAAPGTGGGGGDGTGGAAPAGGMPDPLQTATPKERAAFTEAVKIGSTPVVLDGRAVTPGSLGGSQVNDVTDLPTPLLVVLALLAALGLGAGALGTRHLVSGRRPT